MAADSISKLAVIITGDASPLAAALEKASAITDRWARGMATMKAQNDKWNQGMEVMRQQTLAAANPFAALETRARGAAKQIDATTRSQLTLNRALSAMRGNMSAGLQMGGLGGGSLAAMGAMVFSVRSLARAADDLHQRLDVPKLQTWTGQWERLTGVLGTPFALAARDATEHLANLSEVLLPDSAEFVKGLEAAKAAAEARKVAEEKAKEAQRIATEKAKERADAAERAARAAERERDAMSDWMRDQQGSAERFMEMVRSPLEEAQRTAIEIKSLFHAGFLTQDFASRAIQRAVDQARGDRPSAGPTPGVGAAEPFRTSAGHTAMLAADRNLAHQRKLQEQQLQHDIKREALLQKILAALENKEPIVLTQGEL